jgi:hypothetical protein
MPVKHINAFRIGEPGRDKSSAGVALVVDHLFENLGDAVFSFFYMKILISFFVVSVPGTGVDNFSL